MPPLRRSSGSDVLVPDEEVPEVTLPEVLCAVVVVRVHWEVLSVTEVELPVGLLDLGAELEDAVAVVDWYVLLK